jgi:hypothetical protein
MSMYLHIDQHYRAHISSLGLTNERNWVCIGIRPSGLGLRLISRHPLLLPGISRCPFAVPFVSTASAFRRAGLEGVTVAVLPEVRGAIRFLPSTGLLLLVLARFSGSEPELSASSYMAVGEVMPFARDIDLVIGPKYPSFALPSVGVGEGDITRGVRGCA